MNISNAVKLCRTARDLSQKELAEKADISTSYVSLIEQGKRDVSVAMLEKIAAAMEMPVEALLFMAADKGKLANISNELASEISLSILQLLSVKKPNEARI